MRPFFWFGGSVLLTVASIAACGGSGQTGNTGGGDTHSTQGAGGSGFAGSGPGGARSSSGGDQGGGLVVPDAGDSGTGHCSAYKSCADRGYNCGMAPDGCGNLEDCGASCTAPETCAGGGKQNVCGKPSCVPQTCAEQGFDCGMATDGCETVINCGQTCPMGQSCGAQSPDVCGTGVCTPTTCAAQGFNCGDQGDGCGTILHCGDCDPSQVCGGGLNPQSGVCGTPPCVSQSCDQQNFNCGDATDGCGNTLHCGSCPASQMCGGGGPNVCGGNTCPAGSELVYVWALNNKIYSFDPPSKTFTYVATPDCGASSPNSMAIDRNLVAWLNYLTPGGSSPNDNIYKFDLKTGTGCQASGITIPAGYNQVGMGFSTDTPGGSTETLYVDGIGGAGLARVDMTTKTIIPIGNFANDPKLKGQSCELTGTGSALLYGYFTTSPYVRVAQLDKTAPGDALSDTVLTGFKPPNDWAFTFWGGDFYMYAYPNSSNAPNSSVIQYDPTTGTVDLAYIANVGFTIIGAGVSTCAPTTPCIPKTCAQANSQCGAAGDGCGNIIQCGSCPAEQACVGGTCTAGCTPKSCTDQNFMCGMQGDGCGNALDCGSCPAGDTCNAGTCRGGACLPRSCTEQGYACGSVGDGCGNIENCGTCPAGEVCGGMTPGQCYTPPCTPKTCAQLGYNCGAATDGCGKVIQCGSCSSPQTCGGAGMANVCGGGIH